MKKNSSTRKEQPSSGSANGLIIQQQKAILTKQQAAFNRLVAKVAQLKLQLDETNRMLDEKVAYYHQHIRPLREEELALRKELIRALYQFYLPKKPRLFNKRERGILKNLIQAEFETAFSYDQAEPDADLKEIFHAVEGLSYEEAEKLNLDDMKEDVEAVFRQFGFDANLDDLDPDMSVEEMMRIMEENNAGFKNLGGGSSAGPNAAKKSKKQQQKEDREKELQEIRTKNISVIYKQLAKVFHPDLEMDPGKKIEKEELMKQLTSAYEKKDLYSLLTLELAWIHKEENQLHALAENKLELYNDVLKEQVRNLQDEIYYAGHHPRFEVLQQLVSFGAQVHNLDLNREQKQREWEVRNLKSTIMSLQGDEKTAVQLIKELITDEDEDRKMEKYGYR